MNYDLKMQQQINKLTTKKSLLLHACCAPCSSAVLDRLANIFDITVFFFNPNITEEKEYKKRLVELKKFIKNLDNKNIKVLEGIYEPNQFFNISKGLEKAKERGARCYKCYNLRLEETAKIATKEGFDFFTTTLSISPYKNSNWLNEIGENLDTKYTSTYLYADFKKHDGYKKSIELSKKYNLYRQDYCGCIYSQQEKTQKEN